MRLRAEIDGLGPSEIAETQQPSRGFATTGALGVSLGPDELGKTGLSDTPAPCASKSAIQVLLPPVLAVGISLSTGEFPLSSYASGK
jgi:hypothetical protein